MIYFFSKGKIVDINNSLLLRVDYTLKKSCNCHPETCSHRDGCITETHYMDFPISEKSKNKFKPKVDDLFNYERLVDEVNIY